jgi:hypothetical protein
VQSPKAVTIATPVETGITATADASTDSDTNVNAVPEWVAPRRRPEPIYDPFQPDDVPATAHRIHIVKVNNMHACMHCVLAKAIISSVLSDAYCLR